MVDVAPRDRSRNTLWAIAYALGGKAYRGNQVRCPGPGHSRRDRSLSVTIVSDDGVVRSDDDFIVHSFAGDDWRECREHVATLLGLPKWQPSGDPEARRQARERRRERDIEAQRADEATRIAIARTLWDQGLDPRGTAAEEYLHSRKLVLTDELAGTVLRFHPTIAWFVRHDYPEFPPGYHPTMLVAFRSIATDELVAVHRVRVDQPQLWPKTLRKMIGPVKGAAVKFDTAGEALCIGEGSETVMAARQFGLRPAWALGSAGAIAAFPVIPGIKQLTILAEADAASEQAIEACASRWQDAGCSVSTATADIGSDLNDELMAARS
jgi:putative DNA primase/helicase